MRKLRVFLLTGLTLLCFSGTAYAEWQIDISEWARKVNYNYGNMRRGHFATKNECERARVKMAREAGDRMLERYSKCVGCDEQNSSRRKRGQRVIIGGPTNRTPEEEEMVGRARRTRNPRATLEAMKKERQQKQLDEQKEQQSRAEFEQGKKEMLTRFKGGSGGGGLSLKGSGGRLVLKSSNAPATKQSDAIKDLRNSAFWSLEAAGSASSGDYETAKDFADFPDQEGGDVPLPSVPDVPAPVPANPQARVYTLLIKEANQTTSELKLINTNFKQAKEKKKKLEEKIDLQKIKIKELKQKTAELKQKESECEEKDKQEAVDGLSTEAQALHKKQEEIDALIDAAQALLDEAKEEDKEASKEIGSLTSKRKEQEDNLAKLEQKFEEVNKHPERAENILEKLEEDK
jgi:hypothetical protein